MLLVLATLVRWCSSPDATRLQLRLTTVALLFLYYVLAEFFFQRSLGKVATRTLVVNRHEQRPSLQAILLRTICRFIPLEPISLLFNKNRALHDLLSGTKVVFVNY